MRRFKFSDPDFQAAFKAFLDERRGSPADVDARAARHVFSRADTTPSANRASLDATPPAGHARFRRTFVDARVASNIHTRWRDGDVQPRVSRRDTRGENGWEWNGASRASPEYGGLGLI